MRLIWRKVYRTTGLVFPLVYYLTDKTMVLIVTSSAFVLFFVVDLLRLRYPTINQWIFGHLKAIMREREKGSLSGTTYLLAGSLLAVALFEKGIAITAMVFSCFGDACSAIVGQTRGRVKFWDKSLEGSIACFLACVLSGIILLSAKLPLKLSSVFFGALATTGMEVLPIPLDDNLTVPIFAGIIMTLVRNL